MPNQEHLSDNDLRRRLRSAADARERCPFQTTTHTSSNKINSKAAILRCGHYFCESCIKLASQAEYETRQCPLCDKDYHSVYVLVRGRGGHRRLKKLDLEGEWTDNGASGYESESESDGSDRSRSRDASIPTVLLTSALFDLQHMRACLIEIADLSDVIPSSRVKFLCYEMWSIVRHIWTFQELGHSIFRTLVTSTSISKLSTSFPSTTTMSSKPLSRPFLRPNCIKKQCRTSQIRQESSYRRHTQRLSIPPAPAFTPKSSMPSSSHIIFNPPPSSPNVYHTPMKFLPTHDKRRSLYASSAPSLYNIPSSTRRDPHTSPITKPGTQLHEASSTLPAALGPRLPASAPLPPALKDPYEKKYHLTELEIKEIQRLRAEDPKTWTRVKLAEKFDCSQFFVSLVAKNEVAGKEHDKKLEAVKKRWGPGRSLARHERGRRKELWGRDA
ncbi:hypothetical protein EJ08DRAFT_656069 [Tothia fuscella]|uniref:RING-type domain-containing protein n=1 Tax=Tothia fuscella TaxID=1048955 RepID=A0A9P4P308_9PEZI|nr:hypothetical protein EJ08DRAFT_656069 [Tothia fuscella]